MRSPLHSVRTLLATAFIALMALLAVRLGAAESTNPPPASIEYSDQATLRAFLILQEQLHATQKAVEEARSEAEAAGKRNQQLMAERLTALEQNFAAQRQRDLETFQSENRLVLIVVGILACVTMLVMLLTFWFQMRSVQRFTEVAASLRSPMALPSPISAAAALPPGITVPAAPDTVEQSTRQFESTLKRLQDRIAELEQLGSLPAVPSANGADVLKPIDGTDEGSKGELLLRKARTLLSLERPEDAMDCLDELLQIEPNNAEAHIKQGAALEKLQRFEEAVAAYDRAIAADKGASTAFLLKGGVLHRLKRYDEALACYDLALHSTTKEISGAA